MKRRFPFSVRPGLVPVFTVLLFFAGFCSPAIAVESTDSPGSGTIQGTVLDRDGHPVSNAMVILFDQETGIPIHPETSRPFTEAFGEGKRGPQNPLQFANSVTDSNGRFSIDGLIAGEYRVVAQKWLDATKPIGLGIDFVNGKEIELLGWKEHIQAASHQVDPLVLKTKGTGSFHVDLNVPNNDAYLLVSTHAPLGDPILLYCGWGSDFLSHVVGLNRMPEGETTFQGLPEGKYYASVFANDSAPGGGAASFEIRSGEVTEVAIPLVAAWTNAYHQPPERLVPLVQDFRESKIDLVKLLDLDEGELSKESVWHCYPSLQPLDRTIDLADGRTFTAADLLAAAAYVNLLRGVEHREAQIREKRLEDMGIQEDVSYEDAFRDLYECLGRTYPCFALKNIDWRAVGEEFLPRAKDIKTDEEFGLLCMELVARLEDSHAYLMEGAVKPPRPPVPEWDPGFLCLLDDRMKPVVYHVEPDSPAARGGVRPGMTVVSIDGQSAEERMATLRERFTKYGGFSSERILDYHVVRSLPRQTEKGTNVVLEMEEPDGNATVFRLACTEGSRYLTRLPVPIPGIPDSKNMSWKRLSDEIGYIHVRRVRDDLIPSLDQALREMKDIKGLVIDVRGNTGGGFDSNRALLNFDPERTDVDPERPRFLGPIAILTDAACISAGEGWASWFVANDRATLFGVATAGASARKEIYTLKNGLYKVRSPVKAYKGFLDRPIERRGLEPDVPLRPNARDIANGRDTVLEAAKELLESRISQKPAG